ncbi:MAG: biotin--[acetyl-CoA-carboxylase] ligase [Anaerolineales bacterium]|nr:biotin--[acetyl-CoA-carboxylase] ligase [Anaerolineales bacterium]MDW8278114.1 biotin--[acetyl-CoA-carboxylase] ligase [Anaerolineales bacterium]
MAHTSTPGASSSKFFQELHAALQGILPGEWRYFPSLGSTNDEALAWASAGAPDFSLVIADEQTRGRGRMGRSWFTPPGAALAFSLILRPEPAERDRIGLFSGLGALALVDALQPAGVAAQIKWPNDVLINGKKVAGILVETVWSGMEVESVILGIGVNVSPESVPPPEGLNYPATCVHAEGQNRLSRVALLQLLLQAVLKRRTQLSLDIFLRDWEAALAFRGEPVQVWLGQEQIVLGRILGLETDGSLRLGLPDGSAQVIHFGEVHLRPDR